MELNENLKQLRISKGYTQKEIANKLGISVQAYGRYEINQEPKASRVLEFAKLFGVSTDELLTELKCDDYVSDPNLIALKEMLINKGYTVDFTDKETVIFGKGNIVSKISLDELKELDQVLEETFLRFFINTNRE